MTPAVGLDPARIKDVYERDAQLYLQSLPLEHFMESTAQSTQRKITLESFDVIQTIRPDIQCFSELLVQYPLPGRDPEQPRRVVPDNMVFVHPEPIEAEGSFMAPLQPVGPLLVLEYVSKSNERKDYEDNRRKYEQELKVPYYLLFQPDHETVTVFHLERRRYVPVRPNAAGRLPIPELELEAALLDGWVRFWFRGELVPLPGDLTRQLEAKEKELAAAVKTLTAAERRATAAEEAKAAAEQRAARAEAELSRLKEQLKPQNPNQ